MKTKEFVLQCVKILKAKLWMVILFCTIAVFTSYGLSKMQKKVYQAAAKIIVTPRKHSFTLHRNRRFSKKFMRYFHLTQYYLLYGSNIAQQVVDELNLCKHLSPVANYILPEEIALNILRSKFRVVFNPKTNILMLAVEMTDRELAAKIANKYVEVFRRSREKVKHERVSETISEIEQELDHAKKVLAESEEKVENIKREQNLYFVKGNNVDKDKLMDFNHEYLSVKVERITKEIMLKRIQELSASAKANLLAIDKQYLNLIELKRVLSEQRIKLIDKLQTKGLKHPDIIDLKTKIDVMTDKIDEEVEGLVKGLEIEYDVCKEREACLLETLESAKNELITLNAKEISYLQAEREMKTNQELYVALKKEYIKHLSLYELPDMVVEVVEYAKVPMIDDNVKPQTLFNVASAGMGSLLIGTLLVLIYGFVELEVFQKAREMAYSVMSIIPLGLTQTINHEPKRSVKYDSFRVIATRLNLIQKKKKVKTVFVTSCGAGEGKTTVAVNLAIALADMGKQVLLIDANRKKSDVADFLDIYDYGPGFRQLKQYAKDTKNLITPIVYKNIDLIAGGQEEDYEDNDIASGKYELIKDNVANLIKSLKKYYDFVIIDGPSIIGIQDAVILSNCSDGVLMIVGHKMYPPMSEEEMRKEVDKTGNRLLGVVLNYVYHGDEIYKSYYQVPKKFSFM